MARKQKVGLMVGRFQPLHRGHLKSINCMIQDCEVAIICLGSSQKSREEHDPWTVEERMQMLRNVYGDRIKIVPLNDLDASGPEEWTDYIFDKLSKLGMAEPTDYYTGSMADAKWYTHAFYLDDEHAVSFRTRAPYITAQAIPREIHLIDRDMNPVPPATDVRTYMSLRTEDWRKWVPAVNHDLVIGAYPEEFKVPLK